MQRRSNYSSKKEIVAFPDLQEDDLISANDRQIRKPSKLGAIHHSFSSPTTRNSNTRLSGMSRNSQIPRNTRNTTLSRHTGDSSRSPSKKPQKTARETKRERLVREIHNFDKAQIQASLPDPEEERRKIREMAAEQKMRKAVRDILDDMMQTIVVEVSLKLGGAMHAQQNAIKNIVDQYLGNNPVVNDRVDGLENKLSCSIQTEIKTLLPDVISKLQKDLINRMDTNMNSKLDRSENNTNEKLQDFQKEVDSQTSKIEKLQLEMVGLESELKESTINLKTILSEGKSENEGGAKKMAGEVSELSEKMGVLRDDFEELKVTATEELKTLEANSKHQEMILQRAIQGVTKGKKK